MHRLADDSGMVIVFVAVLLTAMVAMTAVVIDVGQLFDERRQLQNGADAGALAIAEDCARGTITCALSVVNGVADQYADANSSDSASDGAVDPSDFDPAGRVTVRTTTRDGSTGNDSVRLFFAPIFGISQRTLMAQATAQWGSIGSATTVPLSFSMCEWDAMTGGLGAAALPTAVQTIYHHTGSGAGTCLGPAGQNVPGGFGWLDVNGSGTCNADVTTQWVGGDTSPAPPTPPGATGCTDAFFAGLIGQTVLMPIFGPDPATGSTTRYGPGASTEYYIVGFAALEVDGYRIGGTTASPTPPCNNPDRCISGRFVAYYDYGSQPAAGVPNYGAVTISLTG